MGEFGGYDSNGQPTNNPYVAVRTVKVVDPVGGTNLYMLRQDCARIYTNGWDFYTNNANYITFLPTTGSPNSEPDGAPNTIAYYVMNWRNSFHWGPKQAAGLPTNGEPVALRPTG